LVGKNAVAYGVGAPSSLGGINQAVFVYAAKGYDAGRVYELAERAGAPAWYRWCFRKAQRVPTELAPFYGLCYANEDVMVREFDFGPLHTYLEAEGPARLAAVVAADRGREATQPYLRSFLAGESSPRFAAEYSKVSERLFRALLRREPLAFLSQAARSHYIYMADGVRFSWLGARDRRLLPNAWALELAVHAGGVVLALAYLAMYGVGARLLIAGRLGRRRRASGEASGAEVRSGRVWLPEASDRGAAVLVLGALVTSAIFSTVCCENGRWFLQAVPYLVPLLACGLHAAAQWRVPLSDGGQA
jgi:hypothetical protein